MLAGHSPICERLAKINPSSLQGLQAHRMGALPKVLLPSWGEMNLPAQNGAETWNGGKGLPSKEKPPWGYLPDTSWDSPYPAGINLLISPQAQGQVLPLRFSNLRITTYTLVWNTMHGAREGRGESSVPESFRSVSWFNKQNLEVLFGFFFPSCFLIL